MLSLFSRSTVRPVAIRPCFRPLNNFTIVKMGLSTHNVPELKDKSLLIQSAFINGKFIPSSTSKTFSVTDPATTGHIASVPELTVSEVRTAIDAASTAFKTFRNTLPRERARMLRRWYDQIIANKDDLATLITLENGKPLSDARSEVQYAAEFIEWFSEEAPRIYGDTIPSSISGKRIITLRQPVGVCGLITPWNFPSAMITRKVGPALAAGCTVVIKAPAETPLSALALAELSVRAGIPPGVVNVVTASANTAAVGEEMCTNPTIKKLSFTGSTAVGKLLMKQCSGTLKKLSFELGGNAPFIVFDDADVDAAVAGVVGCKFRSSGQTCVCANRIYVQEGIHDVFAEKLAEKVKGFKVGSGYDLSNTHGPLIHERAVGKVQDHVEDALSKGGEVIVGGKGLEELGPHFFQPTVITGMTREMRVHSEETFGPLAAIFSFKTEKEVVELANDTEVGLAGYFYSSDIGRIWRVAEALDVGMVAVNTPMVSDIASPFGGVKESGFGREGSKYGIDEYTIIKSVSIGGIGNLQG